MEIGVVMFPTDLAMRPDDLAREAEARGFRSVFFPEHTHIPTSRKTPWPGGSELPDEYRRTHDPFVALTAAAAVTERVHLGTGICLIAQRDPIVTAKEVASLDFLSGGRVVLGVGVGWNIDEMEHHGVDPARRWRLAGEKVQAMKALWTEEEASFEGEFVSFSASWSWPKPVQQPHPPVLFGGAASDATLRKVVKWADGWMPIAGRYDVAEGAARFRRIGEEEGRDPVALEVSVFGAPARAEVLEGYAEAGIRRAILGLPPASADVVLPLLDKRADLLARFG